MVVELILLHHTAHFSSAAKTIFEITSSGNSADEFSTPTVQRAPRSQTVALSEISAVNQNNESVARP